MVCFDEVPVQLVSEVRAPLPAVPGRVRREDYEYRRDGVANAFVICEPRRRWRHLTVTAHRCKPDFAWQMQWLAEVGFPRAAVIRVVLDNLSMHTLAALYETFAPDEARRIPRRLEFQYTPTHGSWLNMAEIELSIVTRECLGRRIPTAERHRARRVRALSQPGSGADPVAVHERESACQTAPPLRLKCLVTEY